jgi:hypothetical protein
VTSSLAVSTFSSAESTRPLHRRSQAAFSGGVGESLLARATSRGIDAATFCAFRQHALLKLGYGITNVVARATNAADQPRREELFDGGWSLTCKSAALPATLSRRRPHRRLSHRVRATRTTLGLQDQTIVATKIWVGAVSSSAPLWRLEQPQRQRNTGDDDESL